MEQTYRTSFRLKYGRDNQIIEWLESCGEQDKSYYIREALRYYLNAKMPQASPLFPPPLSTPATSQVNGLDEKVLNKQDEPMEEADCKKKVLEWYD